jgi:Putative ABC exporter
MNPALLKLMRFQARAVVRRMFRGAKTVRGAMFLIVGGAMIVLWLAASSVNAFILPRADPHLVLMYFPIGMLTLCVTTLVTTAGERAVAFFPAEVDFLFPGPFTRRELLVYKIFRSSFAALFTATLFSLVFLRFSQHWIGGWIGIFLGLIFIQLISMAVVLIGQTIGERAYTRARKRALIVLAIAVIAIWRPHFEGGSGRDPSAIVESFVHSTPGRILLAPFTVFGRILTANPVISVAPKWIAIAVCMIAAVLAVVLWLDTQYMESAAIAGQKVYDRVQRMRQRGGVHARATTSRLRIPMLPRFGGSGAVAWRQILVALRTSRAMLIIMVIICVSMGPMFYYGGLIRHPGQLISWLIAWITFMLSNTLRFDFRGDLDVIDTLKALPVRKSAIVIAELIAPVLFLIIFQGAILAGICVMLHADLRLITLVIVFALPINTLVIEVENLIFLIFPSRMVNVSPGDLQGFGRQMLVFAFKGVVLLVSVSVAGGIGALVWWAGGHAIVPALICAWIVLAIECAAMIPLLVLAFAKFDPSVDTPA